MIRPEVIESAVLDYVGCIAATSNSTWCRQRASWTFKFRSIEHALGAINQGSRLLVCRRCSDAVVKLLQSGTAP